MTERTKYGQGCKLTTLHCYYAFAYISERENDFWFLKKALIHLKKRAKKWFCMSKHRQNLLTIWIMVDDSYVDSELWFFFEKMNCVALVHSFARIRVLTIYTTFIRSWNNVRNFIFGCELIWKWLMPIVSHQCVYIHFPIVLNQWQNLAQKISIEYWNTPHKPYSIYLL